MNQRLNLKQPIQFFLSPGSDSELSQILDIDDDKEKKIIQFLRRKKIQRSVYLCVLIILICFLLCFVVFIYLFIYLFIFYSFVNISLMLFCLFSAVCHTQKFNLKLPTLITFAMSYCAGFCASKMCCFTRNLR